MSSEFVIIGPIFYYLNQYFHIIFIFLERFSQAARDLLAGRMRPAGRRLVTPAVWAVQYRVHQNTTPCSNTTTQLLDLAGIGTPGPMQSIPVWAIQY